MLDTFKIEKLAKFYRKHLLEDVMPFWEKRTRDEECGGYLTCFNREGNITDTDKYIWFQGRQLWTFSALYNHIEKRPEWLKLARHGRDFIVKNAYAGNGRWNYQLDRRGNIRKGQISIYTDHFVLAGLCEYALATGRDDDLPVIKETYDVMERNVHDPFFKDLFHGTWSPRYKRHGIYMITLNVAGIVEKILGQERARSLIDHCLEQILYVFANDDYQILFESLARHGAVVSDDPEGRIFNPGHTFEAMWFCMEEGRKRWDKSIIARAIKVADWAYRAGYDNGYGGIVAFLDAKGQEPLQMDWHKETNALWHDKVWWVHAEALYALGAAAVITGSPDWFGRFEDLHDWCQNHFYDNQYGEWYAELYRDGQPKNTNKGTLWKAAYHLPRTLMMLTLLFEKQGQAKC